MNIGKSASRYFQLGGKLADLLGMQRPARPPKAKATLSPGKHP